MSEQHIRTVTQALTWQFAIACCVNIFSLAMPIMLLQVYDRIIPHQAYGTLALLTTGVLTALLCDAFLRVARSYLAAYTAMRQEYETAERAMNLFLDCDIQAFKKKTTGTHIQNMMALGKMREFYSGQTLLALVDFPFAFLFLGLIAYLGQWLVLVPLAVLGVFMLTASVAGNHLRAALEVRSDGDDRKSSFIVSVLTAIHTVKAIGAEKQLYRRFEDMQENVTYNNYDVAKASGLSGLLSASFGQITLIMTASIGAVLVMQGQMSVGGLSACTLLAGRTIQPVQRILGAWLRLQDLTVSRVQADALLSMPVMTRQVDPMAIEPGRIALHQVSFTHEGHENSILQDIHLHVGRGEMIAIEGDKGSGKTTLLRLMAGLYVPQKGAIRVNGVCPYHYRGSDMAWLIGYMPQQAVIFKGTIIENLTGFNPDDAAVERARMAAAELGLDHVVNQLPQGYYTPLNDSMSDPVPPGVKQRIALARVLARHPDIILFDDADRTLDKEGYNRLFRLIGKLKGKTTLILVSHDRNLLSCADRHYYLEGGVLSERPHYTDNTVTFLAKSFQRETA